MKDFEKFATKPSSARRKFLKGAGIAAATGTAAIALAACDDKPKKEAKKADKIASPQVSKAKTQVLKVQTSWGSKSFFQDMAKQYVERVDKMSGGRRKIDLLPAGAGAKRRPEELRELMKLQQNIYTFADGALQCAARRRPSPWSAGGPRSL